MNTYSVVHVDHKPANLDGLWPDPRQLTGSYLVYRGECPETPAAYTVPVTQDPETGAAVYPPTEETVAEIATLMYAGHPGPFVFFRPEILKLLAQPQWRVYAGNYHGETDLLSDCALVGITPTGADLAAKVLDAKSQLQVLLTPTQP